MTTSRTIELTRGRVALVDEEDFLRFGHLKWTAGSFGRRTGYAYRSEWVGEKCRSILLHRAILGAAPGQIVDHINGDTFDNRRANLRIVSASQNAFNTRRSPSRYGFVGITSQTSGRYQGRVYVGRRAHYTKSFSSPVLAAAARDVLARQLHGEYAVLNFRFIPASAIRPGA